MGRMLEAFRQPARCRPVADEGETAPCSCRTDEEEQAASEPAVEMPFIEVGGPRTQIEASPSVLANAPLRPSVRQPQSVKEKVESVEPSYRGVSFHAVAARHDCRESPEQRFVPDLVAYHQPHHPVSGQYRTLAGVLAEQLPRTRSQVLLFTSATAEAATTTVVVNLAISYVRSGSLSVVLVDANLGRPSVAERLGLPAAPGLDEVLAGAVSLKHALQESGLSRLTVLPAGARRPEPLTPAALRALWRPLREQFDLVLVDAPCWDGGVDVVTLGAACDAVFLVLPDAQPESPATCAVVEAMRQREVCLLGCIATGGK